MTAVVSHSPTGPGPIRPGDSEADGWGFTADRWRFDSYLWRDGDRVLCSLLIAKAPGTGAFRALVAGIESAGLRVAVPSPLGQMREILERYGFEPHVEQDPIAGCVDVWERAPGSPPRGSEGRG